jgi:hypothetical protein
MSHDSSAFYSLPADERAAAKEAACERYGAEDFFDLDPEQRAETYQRAVTGPACEVSTP